MSAADTGCDYSRFYTSHGVCAERIYVLSKWLVGVEHFSLCVVANSPTPVPTPPCLLPLSTHLTLFSSRTATLTVGHFSVARPSRCKVHAAGFEPKGHELKVRAFELLICTARCPCIPEPFEIRLSVAQLLPAVTATGTRSKGWVVSARSDSLASRWSGILETSRFFLTLHLLISYI